MIADERYAVDTCCQTHVLNKYIAQKMKLFITDFFSKCDQILNGKPHILCYTDTFAVFFDTLQSDISNFEAKFRSSYSQLFHEIETFYFLKKITRK